MLLNFSINQTNLNEIMDNESLQSLCHDMNDAVTNESGFVEIDQQQLSGSVGANTLMIIKNNIDDK